MACTPVQAAINEPELGARMLR
ncbi:unnamed protein product [Ectocarpus sp. CCAP 1310/34]|nr:unnamed protein product [Ectocarpus sp. CCAP 1310/34]